MSDGSQYKPIIPTPMHRPTTFSIERPDWVDNTNPLPPWMLCENMFGDWIEFEMPRLVVRHHKGYKPPTHLMPPKDFVPPKWVHMIAKRSVAGLPEPPFTWPCIPMYHGVTTPKPNLPPWMIHLNGKRRK